MSEVIIAAKPKDYSDIIGKEFYNSKGTPFVVLSANTTSNVLIEFQDNYKVQKRTTIQNVKKGVVWNPYDRTIFGTGFIGEGPYKARETPDKQLPEYNAWKNILERCYSEKLRFMHSAYEDCECCEEWYNYQNFAKWYHNNFYRAGTGRMHIDKDIKIKGNKLYSPDKCIFVPQKINMIFMSKPRKDNLPTGVEITKHGKYYASYNGKHLGVYQSAEMAKEAYLSAKRAHIRDVVKEFGDELPDSIHRILLNW